MTDLEKLDYNKKMIGKTVQVLEKAVTIGLEKLKM